MRNFLKLSVEIWEFLTLELNGLFNQDMKNWITFRTKLKLPKLEQLLYV